MPANKTQATAASVAAFVDAVPDSARRADAQTLIASFERVTGDTATMWGAAIIGFGRYTYRLANGRDENAPRLAFSPRKGQTVLYLPEFDGRDALLARLGNPKTGKACVYLKRLGDLDALDALLQASDAASRASHPD